MTLLQCEQQLPLAALSPVHGAAPQQPGHASVTAMRDLLPHQCMANSAAATAEFQLADVISVEWRAVQ